VQVSVAETSCCCLPRFNARCREENHHALQPLALFLRPYGLALDRLAATPCTYQAGRDRATVGDGPIRQRRDWPTTPPPLPRDLPTGQFRWKPAAPDGGGNFLTLAALGRPRRSGTAPTRAMAFWFPPSTNRQQRRPRPPITPTSPDFPAFGRNTFRRARVRLVWHRLALRTLGIPMGPGQRTNSDRNAL